MPVNPFELLGDVDSTDTTAFVPQPKVAAPAPVAVEAPVAAAQKKQNTPGKKGPVGSNEKRNRGPRQPREPRDNNTSDIARPSDLEHPVTETKRTRDAHHKGPRGGASSGRKREFDRKSGMGREDGDKKDNDRQPVEAEIEGAKDLVEEIAAENIPAEEVVAPAEPEEVQLTLEQYLAQVKANKVAADVAKRTANEGVDAKLLKENNVFQKEDEVLFAGKAQKEKKVKEVTKEKKATVELQFKFADETPAFAPRERREERPATGGARGGARGGRGGARGGARPASGRAAAPAARGGKVVDIADTNAFPSLGGK